MLTRVKEIIVQSLDDNGQVAIIAAVVIMALLASLSLVMDVGMIYQARRQAQTAADAGALAAAERLAEGESIGDALQAASQYSQRNGISSAPVLEFPDAISVTVKIVTVKKTAVARVFGRSEVTIGASATASWKAASGVVGLAPFAVPRFRVSEHVGVANTGVFELGDDRPLSSGGATDVSQQGYFWLVNFDDGSGGVPDYRDWIVNGYPYEISVGDILNGTGVKSTLRGALDERMQAKPEIIVPVYESTTDSGSKGTYQVSGFAEFHVASFSLTGNPKSVTGYFTNGRVAVGSSTGTADDFGVKVVWLSD